MPTLVWIGLSLIWGSTWLFIKVGLQDLPPLTFATVRFVLAIGVLLPVVAMRHSKLPRDFSDWTLMIGTGVLLFAVTYGLVFWGEQHISSGMAALLFSTFPLFGLVIAHFHLHDERMTPAKMVGTILGIAGVALVLSNQLEATGELAFWASAGIVGSAGAAAYADVLIKARGGHLDPTLLTLVQMCGGVVPLAALSLYAEGNPLGLTWSPRAVISTLYLALVGTALGFVLLYWLFKHMDVTRTMLITFVTPLVAVALGVVVLHEEFSWRAATGGAAIIAGLGFAIKPPTQRRAQSTQTGRHPNAGGGR
ncbi:MAG: DMT family transporter [Gemmatimonadales bacterium]